MEITKNKKYLIALVVLALLFPVILAISHIEPLNAWFSSLMRLFRPVLIGAVIAYLFNSFFRIFERKCFSKIRPIALRRGISLFFTYLVLVLIFVVLVVLIVPQLLDSIMSFVNNMDTHIDSSLGEINHLISMINDRFASPDRTEPLIPLIDPQNAKATVSRFFQSIKLNNQTLLQVLKPDVIGQIFNLAGDIFNILTDIILGLFISLYLLNTKEKRYAQIMRLRKVLFSDKVNEVITRICTTADKSFGGFIKGKILDSCMVGVLVYVAISLLGVPYAILIAVIVAITDIIPVIGPFIGVIPSAIIILLTDPSKVIPFLLCILIVQQIDGNIIAPKILGENTGVSSLCVIIAITTMGALWGLVGMVIGVPLFATVLELVGGWMNKRLEKKGLSSDIENYYFEGAEQAEEEEGNFIQRIQKKKLLRLRKESIGGQGDLTALERFQLESYALMRKYKIDTNSKVEIPEAFVEEENALTEAVIEQVESELEEAELEEAELKEQADFAGAEENSTDGTNKTDKTNNERTK